MKFDIVHQIIFLWSVGVRLIILFFTGIASLENDNINSSYYHTHIDWCCIHKRAWSRRKTVHIQKSFRKRAGVYNAQKC